MFLTEISSISLNFRGLLSMISQKIDVKSRVGIFIIIAVLLCLFMSNSLFAQQNRGAIVQVDRVEKMMIPNYDEIGGHVVAGDPVSVTASSTAKIEIHELQIGDLVKAGDIIAKQDTFLIEHQLKIHLAELETTKNEIASLKKNLEHENSLLSLITEQLALLYQRAEYTKKLAKGNAISFENAENAEIAVNAARQQLIIREKEKNELNYSLKRLAMAEKSLLIQIKKLEQDILDATLTSPVNGQIISLFSEQIGFARQGDEIASIRTKEGYEVELDLPVKYLPFIKSEVPLKARSQTGERLMLSLRVILPEENRRTSSRFARLSFNGDISEDIRSNGAQIDVLVPSSEIKELLVIPQDAVIPVAGGYVVFVFDQGVAKRQAVRLGAAIDDRITVKTGLQEGELIITRGNEGLDDGVAVKQGKMPKRDITNQQKSTENTVDQKEIPTELADDAKTWLLKWQTSRGEQTGKFQLSSKASLYNEEPVLVTRRDGAVYFDTELVLPFGIVTLSFELIPTFTSMNGIVILSGLPNGKEVQMDVTGTEN